MINKNNFFGVGRRKEASATVYLREGNGNFIVNNKNISNYFYMDPLLTEFIIKPLEVLNLTNSKDLFIRVKGGGFSSQAEAIRLGISKALVKIDESYKPILKGFSLLKKIKIHGKERKKIGKKGARESPQWRKR